MPFLVGEANDLVFERRAVSRTDAANLTVEERRAIDIRSHEIAHAIVGVEEVAINLRAIDWRREKRERHGRRVAALGRECSGPHLAIEIDAVAIETRRRAGLQSAPLEAARLERFGQLARR